MVMRHNRSVPSAGTGPGLSAAPAPHCDVAIVGAGVGGLTAGAMLAKAGLDVVVLEAEDQPGGYLAAFRRGEFLFDTSIQWLNQFRPKGFVARIHDYLGTDVPPCKPLRRVHRYKSADYDYVLTSRPNELCDQLRRDFPVDAAALDALFREAKALGEHLRVMDDRMQAACTMTTVRKIRRGLAMLRWIWPLRRHVSMKATDGLARRFTSPRLRDMFYSGDSMLSVLIPIALAFMSDFQAAPAGGGAVIIQRLSDSIMRHGGDIQLNTAVSDIIVNTHRQATGVQLADGRVIIAKFVIAACDPLPFLRTLESRIPAVRRMLGQSTETDLYYSSFSIYLGLDCQPAVLGLGEELVHLFESSQPACERAHGDPHATLISVIAPSHRDASLAPCGKGTLQIQCPAFLSYRNGWETGPGFERTAAYARCKAEFADILLDRVERDLIPGLRRHIEVMTVATPVTFMRYTGNRLGTIMGHRPGRANIRARVANIKTPVRNLLIGGHWAEYGGGVPMATKAAVNASLVILQAMRPAVGKTLEAVLAGTDKRPLTIGIPRALEYYLYPGLWEAFFRELGMNVVVSGPVTRQTVERAGLISETEHCFPVKLYDAQLAALAGRVDAVFVPRILSSLTGHIACPKLGALPDCARAQFAESFEVISVDINEAVTPLATSLAEAGRLLKVDARTIHQAATAALEALRVQQAQRDAPPPGRPAGMLRFLIIGHPYNIHDPYLVGPVMSKLQSLGVAPERIQGDGSEAAGDPIKWDTCSVIYHHLQRLTPEACSGVIQLSSFNCGCDSIAGSLYRECLRDKGIPCMTLVLDEHAGQAGVDTRLEAFVDSIRDQHEHAITRH